MTLEQGPLISVITVCLNESERMAQTLDSIVGQHYPHRELIVIDGGSTDGTLDVIRGYQDQIGTLISE